MADEKVTYGVVVEDDASGAALSAAAALRKLDEAIQDDTKSLAALQKQMKNLQGGSSVNVDSFRKLQAQIDATKNRIASSQQKVIDLGGGLGKMADKGKGAGAGFKALAGQAQSMPGPIGGVVSRLQALRSALAGGAISLGIVAIAAALAALSVAAIAATRALYNYGVAQADARRSELLRLEGLTKMRFFFQRVPGNAKEMQNAIDQVAAKTPVAREQVAKYSDELYRMGLRGDALTKTLEGVAIKSATQGEEAANTFAGWAAGANLAGHSVDKLVDNVKARLGGIAQKQMQSLTVQTMKQKEAQDALFSGLDIDKWLGGWKDVRDLLTQATASGRALKLMVSSLLQPLINASASGTPVVKRFFQGMIIAGLHVLIAVLTLRNWFKKTFGDRELFGGMEKFAVFMGKFVAAGTLGTLVVLLGAFAAAVTAIVGPVLSVFYAVHKLWNMFIELQSLFEAGKFVEAGLLFFDTLFDTLMSTVPGWFVNLGAEIVGGIIKGMGGTELIDTAKKMANDMLVGFSGILGIESPSKAFARLGKEIPAGVEQGIEAGAPEAKREAQQMVDASAPELGPRGAPGGALAPGGAAAAMKGGTTITIEQVVVQATSDKPEQLASDFRRELEKVLEDFAHELGAPEPEPAS